MEKRKKKIHEHRFSRRRRTLFHDPLVRIDNFTLRQDLKLLCSLFTHRNPPYVLPVFVENCLALVTSHTASPSKSQHPAANCTDEVNRIRSKERMKKERHAGREKETKGKGKITDTPCAMQF